MDVLSRIIPSPRCLFVFETAARTGSFTAAAREFNVTQPSVSRSIAQLESDLQMRLFERRPSGLVLTAEGRELHVAVRLGLGRIVDTLRLIQDRQRASKPVVALSLSSSFVTHWLVPRLSEFNATFPGVDLRFELIAGVMRGGIPENVDLATRIVSDEDTLYHRWELAPEVVVPVCSPAYLAAHGRLDHEGDGSGHVFLNLTDHDLRGEWAGAWGKVLNASTRSGVWHKFSDYAVILQAAINSEGVALGWLSVVSSALAKGLLVPASLRQIDTGRRHRLIAPRAKWLPPHVADIAEWFSTQMAEDLRAVEAVLQAEA